MASKEEKIQFLATLLAEYYDDIINGKILPSGGKSGQALVKGSDEDGDYIWSNATSRVDASKNKPINDDVLVWFNIDESTDYKTLDVYSMKEIDNKINNIGARDIAFDKETGKLYLRSLDDTIHSEGILISDIGGTNEASNIAVKDVAGYFASNNVEEVLAELAVQPIIQVLSRKDTPIYNGAKLIIDVTEEVEDLNNNNNDNNDNNDSNDTTE